jgi:hypothetical protein
VDAYVSTPPRVPEGQTLLVSRRDPLVTLGMAVAATSAAVSSFDGLRSLAVASGWAVMLAPLLPLTIDSYAMTSVRVWLSATTSSQRARRFARTNAIGAIGLSLAGNAAWHLIAAKLLSLSWVIVLGVGSVPALILGLVSHLAVLRNQVDPVPAGDVLSTPLEFGNGTQYADEDALLAAARAADAAWRADHGGRSITRDELRRNLRVSGVRATAVLRAMRAEQAHATNARSVAT